MYPFLKPGDRIVVKKGQEDFLQVGDIIVIPSKEDKYVIHRLIKMLPPDRCVLKGDSLLNPDPEPIKLSDISGKVIAILRRNRFIPVDAGVRSRLKHIYAFLSIKGLTIGALRLRAKNLLLALFPSDTSNNYMEYWKFCVAALCGLLPEPLPELDQAKVLEISLTEGVAGVLYESLKEKDFHGSLLALLEKPYRTSAVLNLMNISALEGLEKALIDADFEVLTLKGASLLGSVYSRAGVRPMNDIDLMVRPEHLNKFINILYTLGFKKDADIAHYFQKDRVSIDLHINALNTDRISSRSRLFPSGMGPIWDNSVPWRDGFHRLRRPDDIDNILLLCQHFMKHSFSRLIWLKDIFELIRDRGDDFMTRLYERADQLSQGQCLCYTLYLLDRLFAFKPIRGSMPEKVANRLNRIERGILGARIRGQSIERTGPALAVFCIHGMMNRFRFLWETIFPKKEVFKEEFMDFYGGKRILFYPSRFLQTVRLLIRQSSLIILALIKGS